MAYIGRPLQVANLAVQSGTGDGADTTPIATLDYATTTNGIAVYLDGVRQLAGTDFNVTAQTTLTFTTAPANSVGIDVYFLGLELSLPTPADATVTTAKLANNSVTSAKIVDATIVNADIGASAAIAQSKLAALASANMPAGSVVQVVNVTTGAVATGTTVLPGDNTIPVKTEGDQYMSLAITPTDASNKLFILITAVCGNSAAGATAFSGALFQDSTSAALAASQTQSGGSIYVLNLNFNHYMTAGTTSATTFKVRLGGGVAGTTTFNGQNGSRLLGGIFPSSITIMEIAV